MRPSATRQTSPPPTDRPASRLYYGYVMLPIATLAFIATAPAQTFGISAFNQSLRTSLNLSHSQLTGAYMLGTFLAALPLSWIGQLMDRYGLRKTMTGIVLIFGAVCIASSQVTGLLTLFLSFMMLRMLGQGALGLLAGNTLAFWFQRRLGTVEGIRRFGMAGAIAVVPGLNLWLIHAVGWRSAWVILGVAVWALMLPLMLLFRNRPTDVGQHMDGGAVDPARPARQISEQQTISFTFTQARRTRSFWIACAITALWAMVNTAVMFNIVPLFESRGLTEADAARLFTGFAISLALVQLVGGVLADRCGLNYLLAAAVAGMAIAMTLVWQIDTPALVLPLSVVMGSSQGLLSAAEGPFWPRYYGTEHLGRLRGSLATVMVAASSVGPFILGLCVDWTGSYNPALIMFAAIPVPLIGLALLATPPRHPEADSFELAPDTPPEAA